MILLLEHVMLPFRQEGNIGCSADTDVLTTLKIGVHHTENVLEVLRHHVSPVHDIVFSEQRGVFNVSRAVARITLTLSLHGRDFREI